MKSIVFVVVFVCVDSLKRVVSGGGIYGDLSVLSTHKVHGSAHSLFPHTSIDSDGGSELLTVHFCMLMCCIILYVAVPFGSLPY